MACQPEIAIDETDIDDSNNFTFLLNDSFGDFDPLLPLPGSTGSQSYESFRHAVTRYVIPSVLSFGIVGNSLNLCLFGHRFGHRGGHQLELLERSALAGLTALALSDLLFCVVGVLAVALPRPLPGRGDGSDGSGLSLVGFYYGVYQHALQNWFLFTSTWVTVAISVERFVVVGRPLKARWHLRARNSALVYLGTFVVGGLVSLPLFLRHSVVRMPCLQAPSCTCTYIKPRPIFLNPGFRGVYNVFWVLCGHLLPTVVLAVANGRLLWVLYRSRAAGIASPDRYACTSITVTVVAIVCSFLLLVCPSMVFDSVFMLSVIVASGSGRMASGFRMAIAVTNLMQAIKFSVNFLLYCGVMKQFRKTISDVTTCQRNSRIESLRSSVKPTPL